jgi:hypothetical protein
MAPALLAEAKQMGAPLPAELSSSDTGLPPGHVVGLLSQIAGNFFPLLEAPAVAKG